MIEARSLGQHYRIIRARLRNPPNAVPDTGINLRKHRQTESHTMAEESETRKTATVSYPSFPPFKVNLTFSSTLCFVAKEFNISSKEIRAHTRLRAVTLPRQIAIWIAHKNKVQTMSAMGRHLKMDHTTMLHARRNIEKMCEKDATLMERIISIEEKLLATHARTTVPSYNQSYMENQEIGRDVPFTRISSVDKSG